MIRLLWARRPVTLVLILVVACGPNDEPPDRETTGPTGGESPEGGDAGIDYLDWGPNDPPIPDQYAALAASSGTPPDCDRVADAHPGGDFWVVAVAVCRAMTGDPAAWPSTTTVPDPPSGADAFEQCLNSELAAMLQRALDWHQAHDGEQPQLRYPPSHSVSPCQNQIYSVQIDDADASWLGNSIPVVVDVAILGEAVSVRVDGEPPLDFTESGARQGLRTVTFLVPPAAEARTAAFEISTDRTSLQGAVELPASEAEEPSETSDPGSETDSTEPGPTPSDQVETT